MAKINETFVKKCPLPQSGHKIHYDDDIHGFGLRVTKAGTKSFILNYHINGRERRMTIGQFPDWSAKAAREEAKAKKRAVDRGEDPLAERIEAREAPTIGDLWKSYKSRELPKKAPLYQGELERMWEGRILPTFKNVRARDLTRQQVADFHSEITAEGFAVRANRVVGSLRAVLNIAKRDGHIATNPADSCGLNRETPKERYLDEAELAKVVKALSKMPNQNSANAIRMLILTGARRSEVFGAEWAEFNLKDGVWHKPAGRVKDRKPKRIPLSKAVLDLLTDMKRKTNSKFLFPSPTTDSHIVDIRKSWDWLKQATGIQDIRIHDLRHTFASFAVSEGHSLPTIGALLGHGQIQTTMRYAHLMDEPLRAAANQMGERVSK